MNYFPIIQMLGGLGLLFFSLRFLSRLLSSSVARRFKPWLTSALSNHWRCLSVGIIVTLLVQASSITIMTSMGLVNTSLITLEQSVLIMLGATFGTSIKAVFFSKGIWIMGPALIGFASLALVFCKKMLARDILEMLAAIGLTFLGLSMIVDGVTPFLANPDWHNLWKFYNKISFGHQILALSTGLLLTIATQSSSAVVFLILQLGMQGVISFPAGAAMILGANIGTTSTGLLLSIEHSPNVKRLAVAHCLVKLIGVAIALLLFPSFLSFIDILIPDGGDASLANHLAAVHIVFNLLNMSSWAVFSGLLLRLLRRLVPGADEPENTLPVVVRKMLINQPTLALEEVEIQITQIKALTKSLTDYCLELLMDVTDSKNKAAQYLVFGREFADRKEAICEILMQLSRNPLPQEIRDYIKGQLYFMSECEELYYHAFDLKIHLEHGIRIEHYHIPGTIKNRLAEFQHELNRIWLAVTFNRAGRGPNFKTDVVLAAMEQDFFQFLLQKEKVQQEHLVWVYEMIGYLRQIANRLISLYQHLGVSNISEARQ